MFAIIETGGKQYRVSPQDKIIVEKVAAEQIGSKVVFDKVLLINESQGSLKMGDPYVKNARIEAELIKNFKDDKVLIFKKRRRKNSRRKRGHRQQKSLLKIISIQS